ncbi:glycosyl hydrolase [Wenyingzhuangia sp. IMCC45467]
MKVLVLLHQKLRSLFLICLIVNFHNISGQNKDLSSQFKEAKGPAPSIIWQWMNGVVSKEGITADLEAFKEIGFAGVYNFQVGGDNQALANDPSVKIGNDKWKELMRFSIDECARLGLTFGTHNCPGWSSSAAPCVKVEHSMQKLVWTQIKVNHSIKNPIVIKQPSVDKKWNYYQDIAVIAIPDQDIVSKNNVIDISDKMTEQGVLNWKVPKGKWIILRFGHTTTGQTNINTSPLSGVGLECDKLSKEAVKKYWSGYPSQLIALAGKNAGTTFTQIEIDSYEAGEQNWTPEMLYNFKKLRGYDLLSWMPVIAGKTIESKALSSRFKYDWKKTISDLFANNYYLYMDELTRETPGMDLLVEPYTGPFDIQSASGGESQLACEFWTRPNWGWKTVQPVVSAAHTLGKQVVNAEAFTCWPLSAWQDGPYELKGAGDRAFCKGVNQLMLHAAAQNPWTNVKPGMTFGKWGTQFSPGQTWWNHGGKEWVDYLTRCQLMLQKGLYVGDICYLQLFGDRNKNSRPKGYAGDECGERAFLERMTVKDGRLQMPDGMSYSVLVLPKSNRITEPVAKKIRQLVKKGAVVIGAKPNKAIDLENYPANDECIKKIGDDVWGDCDGNLIKEHKYGKGKVFCGESLPNVLHKLNVQPDLQFSDDTGLEWIHKKENNLDIYFISNQENKAVKVNASFRIQGKEPELWHADTGQMEKALHWKKNDKRTDVLLNLDPRGSVFVVFQKDTSKQGPGLSKNITTKSSVINIEGAWKVNFPSGWGAPESIVLDELSSWTDNKDSRVKYFSGTASYVKEIEVPASFCNSNTVVSLDLGAVKNIAEVFLNGEKCGTLWKPPFRLNFGSKLKTGKNILEVQITNLWPNRMIGDEFEPEDAEWGEPFVYPYAPGNPVIGRMLATVPQWLVEKKLRPSKNRYTFVSFKFFNKDSKLLPSGLLGPVKLESKQVNNE